MEKVIGLLEKYNRFEGPAIDAAGQTRLQRANDVGELEFGIFTCPPIMASRILGENPAEYILIDPSLNTLEKTGQLGLLKKLFRGLSEAGKTARLRIIIGDTDEPDYYFPVVTPPANLDMDLCEAKKATYAVNLEQRMAEVFPWLVSIDRYSQIEGMFDEVLPEADLSSKLTSAGMRLEVAQMAGLFGPKGYYEGLTKPSAEQLDEIVRLKFQTYGRQGLRLAEFYPNMVLIQNEFPLALRTDMLNLLTSQLGRERLPAIYPFADRR